MSGARILQLARAQILPSTEAGPHEPAPQAQSSTPRKKGLQTEMLYTFTAFPERIFTFSLSVSPFIALSMSSIG